MVKLLGKVAELRHVGIFPRFEVMRDWHEKQAIPIDNFVIADGLHMNDWGYACFAQLLGDDIIKSVGQIKLGVNVPSERADLPADVNLRAGDVAHTLGIGQFAATMAQLVTTLTPSPAPLQNPRSDRRDARARRRSG